MHVKVSGSGGVRRRDLTGAGRRKWPARASFCADDAVERLGVDPAGQAAAGFAQCHLAIAGQFRAFVQHHPIALRQLAERPVAGVAEDRGAPQHGDRGNSCATAGAENEPGATRLATRASAAA